MRLSQNDSDTKKNTLAHCCEGAHTHTHACTGTTHCHVFDIHLSLSLQLSYYLPVEPLELQVRKRRDQRQERGRKHTRDYKLDRRMEHNCLSTLMSAVNRKILSVSKRETESDHFKCISECVRG